MNWRPLLKISGILVLTWILFFIAQKSFQAPSTDHLKQIPAHADAVLILNNKKIGGALFYQRFYNEDEFKSRVEIDEELEKELVADAIEASIDLLSPIACFSYSKDGEPVVGIALKASDEEGVDEFLKKYLPKTGLDFNYEVSVNDDGALVLFTEKTSALNLAEEINGFSKKYGSAMKESWFEPLLNREHDMAVFFNPHHNSGSVIVDYLDKFTPPFVENSYSFFSIKEDKLSIIHQAQTKQDVDQILSQDRKSLDLSEGLLSGQFHWNSGINYDHEELSEVIELPTDSGIVELYLDSLLAGDISFWMNGLGVSLKSQVLFPTADGVASFKVNEAYWQSKKSALLDDGGLEDVDGAYKLKNQLPIFLREDDGYVYVSQRKNLLNEEMITSDQNFSFQLQMDELIENIDFLPLEDTWGIKTVALNGVPSKGNELKFEGSVVFKHSNHGMIDVLHMLTTIDEEIEALLIQEIVEILSSVK